MKAKKKQISGVLVKNNKNKLVGGGNSLFNFFNGKLKKKSWET